MFQPRRSSALLSLSLLFSLTVAVAPLGSLRASQPRDRPSATMRRVHNSAAARCRTRNSARGTVTYTGFGFPDTLNPYQSNLFITHTIDMLLFDTPFGIDPKARFFGMMAASVPSATNGLIRDGGKTFVVPFKKGLRWSNNTEITSYDLAFGFKVDSDPLTGPVCLGSCDVIKRIDTPNRYTAVLHLKRPFAATVAEAIPDIWPRRWQGAWDNNAHAAAVRLSDPSYDFANPGYPTSGPYQVTELVQNDRVVLRPMRYYDDMSCGAHVGTIIYSFFSSKQGLIAAAAARQVDATFLYWSMTDVPALRRLRASFTTHVDASTTIETLELNVDPTHQGHPNPLHDARVRQALALAFDKLGAVRSALGVSRKVAQQLIAWTFIHPRLMKPYGDGSITGQWDPLQRRYDAQPGTGRALADARRLLAETPYKDGFTLDFVTTAADPVRQGFEAVVAANWARLGVSLAPTYVSVPKLLGPWEIGGVLHQGNFQVALNRAISPTDPDTFRFSMSGAYIDRRKHIHSGVNENDGGIDDAELNRDYSQAIGTVDVKLRARWYHAAQQRVNKLAYWIPVYFQPSIVTDDRRMVNFRDNPFSITWNAYAWKVKGP